ncbi:hypothetical protein L2E82_47387 [Cichorium intybus]|uniref:Uncharacterized protein n=1 Tax=Cichorium intybus TaxID=13427 RepID=A0ACB8YWK5_CICIN|nr:hypothetical protein L2E82_47387 [Cichorium intybus]
MGLTCVRMRGVRKACKTFISKHHLGKKSHPKTKDKHKHHLQVDVDGDGHETEGLVSPKVSIPKLLRTASAGLLRSFKRKNVDSSIAHLHPTRNNPPILYSNSNGLRKPPDMVKRLECTLEELCFGCIKKVNIKRDVVTDEGQVVQEDQVLKINIKPGWRKGTKITFEGMGNETTPTCTADITFVIEEKRHPVFKRNGDDLEVAIELPLVDALTGCTVTIPFLGGQESHLIINDDVITPGYTKSIEGEGMPLLKEEGKRGNLNIKFSVKFPKNLTEEQRSECFSILQHSC